MPRPKFDPTLPPHVTEQMLAERLSRAHRRQLAAFDPVKRQAPKNGHGTPPDYSIGG